MTDVSFRDVRPSGTARRADRRGVGRIAYVALAGAAVWSAAPAAAQSVTDLIHICAEAVLSGQPPSFDGRAPYGVEGDVGDAYVVRAWDNLETVAYLEFLSQDTGYETAEGKREYRTGHECGFQLRDPGTDLAPVVAAMIGVLQARGEVRDLEIDETFPRALFTCREDGLPLTLTVKRNSDGVLWVRAGDTTWDLPGC